MPTVPDAPTEPVALALAVDFPQATRDEWRALVSAVLAKSGGDTEVDPEQALTFRTYDDIDIRPLYTAADVHGASDGAGGLPGDPPFVRGATVAAEAWQVCTRHDDRDPRRANRAVLEDLERGSNALWLQLGSGGLAIEDLDAALAGVHLDAAPITLDAGVDAVTSAAALIELARSRSVDAAALGGSFGADPIGCQARTGAVADLDMLAALVDLRAAATGVRIATVDATVYHDAGASDAQELGIATAVAVAYLRALTAGGLDIDQALAAVEFRWAVTAEQFPSIAKLRAARRIWDRVAELSGASDARRGQRQHAVTSAAMMTQRDPAVNMLRSTIACFAAAVGGADAITVLPFDDALGEPGDLSLRIARNTHAILHDEASLARVRDPAGGSWFVESLTDELAAAGWNVFTEIERADGALKALDAGELGTLILRTRAARADDVAHRRAPITGVSEFAFIDEVRATEAPPRSSRGSGSLRRQRWAEPFEEQRDRADAAPQRPRVFLAVLGPVPAHTPRVAFATNLFAAGGIAPVVGTSEVGGSSGTTAIVDAFRQSGTTVACICGPDRIYEHAAQSVAGALRDAGARTVWLAGQLETDGVDGYLYTGCDAVAVIRRTLDALGVAE